eukprot:8848803-Karenia_brevis.AAC.1
MLARSVDHKGSDVRMLTEEQMCPTAWPRRPINSDWWCWYLRDKGSFVKDSPITELEARGVLAS